MPDCVQVTTTLPDRAVAGQLGGRLVEERLAACAQVVGPISSTYWWEGRVETAEEWYCHVKTTVARLPDLLARVRALHPYAVPEIVALPIVDGHPDYLSWIESSVSEAPPPGASR